MKQLTISQPCPCCGSKNIFVSHYDFRSPESQDIVCMDCPVGIGGTNGVNSYEKWNNRPHTDLSKLKALFERFATHDKFCIGKMSSDCSCGFDDAVKEVAAL